MSKNLLKNIFKPIKQLVSGLSVPGPLTATEPASNMTEATVRGQVLSFDPERQKRRQESITLAMALLNKLEKKDYAPTVSELWKMTPEERVSVAEKMMCINKQHRSIISSLPHFNCSYLVSADGRKDLDYIEISHIGTHGVTNNTFCFSPD